MKNHRHASCCFCARQTFIVVRKEVIFIHISRYTFCMRSCIFMAWQPASGRVRRARVCPPAIKGSETLFKPDTPTSASGNPLVCRGQEIPAAEQSLPVKTPIPATATLRRLISSGRLKTNGHCTNHNENLFRASIFCVRNVHEKSPRDFLRPSVPCKTCAKMSFRLGDEKRNSTARTRR